MLSYIFRFKLPQWAALLVRILLTAPGHCRLVGAQASLRPLDVFLQQKRLERLYAKHFG